MVASYFEVLANMHIKCNLCPRHCVLRNGEIGFCRSRKNQNGIMILLHYGKVTAIHLDPIEKKPFAKFKSGSYILSIGGYGCNFTCQFCQNWTLVYLKETQYQVSENSILDYASRDNAIGLAFTYNEPTVWYEYMFMLAKESKKRGLTNVMVSNGYICEAPLKALMPYIDAVNIDLKFSNNIDYKKHTGGDFDSVINTISICKEYAHVEVSLLLIAPLNTRDEDIEKVAKTIAGIDKCIPLHLSRYYPAFNMTLPPTDTALMYRAKRIAKQYLDHVFLGNMP